MYISNRSKQRSRPPPLGRTPSTARRQYDDLTSRQFDRSRIQNELNNLFDSWSLNDDDDFPLTLPVAVAMESPQPSSMNDLDHTMDPSFDPIHDRVDTDVYLKELVIGSNSLHDDDNVLDDFHSATDDCNDEASTSSKPRTSFQEGDIEDPMQPLVDQEDDVDDDNDINDDQHDEERHEGVNDENHEYQNSRLDKMHSSDEVESTSPPMQSQPLPPSTAISHYNNHDNPIMEETQPKPPSSPPQQQHTQESIIDGFSILQEESSPQRKMIVSFEKDYKFHQSKSSGMNDDHPPELLMLSMDSSMTHSEDTLLTCKSQLSYEDSPTITPSVAFFLGANKQELNNEGLSIANESHIHNRRSSISPTSTSRKYLSSSSLGLSTDDIDNESQTAIGYSKGSSKYTVETPRILELREKKRLMERVNEIRFHRFPALIEVDKVSTKNV